MKWNNSIRRLFLVPVMLLFVFTAYTQSVPCEYRLELFDLGGDGWNGASLVVTINGENDAFTLNGIDDDGTFAVFPVTVTNLDTVSLTFLPGSANGEIVFRIFAPTGVLVVEEGPFPLIGTTDPFLVLCPTCPPPPPNSILIEDVSSTTADLNFRLPDPDGQYLIRYDTSGFDPETEGLALVNFSGDTTLENLMEKTLYDVYIATACANGDTSVQLGPFSFETLWSVDVGVSGFVTPVSGCGLTNSEEVLVVLENFGNDPLSLIPFKYNVNGMDAGISMPQDGLYTGVLGRDSTDDAFPFDAKWDFSVPQEYTITAWTELEEDRDNSNDTSQIVITNIPFVMEYPYYENFEEWKGGWLPGENGQNSSWEFGEPQGNVVTNAFSGENAWVTNLEGLYNDNELSYLVSPCFDFSELEDDPVISFFLNFLTESTYDFLWLESSVDGGESWSKVGTAGSGVNWYNDASAQAWTGDANIEGWTYAADTLSNLAGEADVRLRFVFSSDISTTNEGAGLDDIFVGAPLENDLIAINLTNTGEECGSSEDVLTITLGNYGQTTRTDLEITYQINNGEPITEEITDISIAPGEQISYTFQTPFSSSIAGSYDIRAWMNLEEESLRLNDTTRLSFTNALALPFVEDFEEASTWARWELDEGTGTTRGHNNTSDVLFDNLWSQDPIMSAITPSIGPIVSGDSLAFEYRYVDFDRPHLAWELGEGDTLFVDISTDCGETFQTIHKIHSMNHDTTQAMTQVRLSLENYVGLAIKVRILVQGRISSGSDYYIDIDNVNVFQCRDLQLRSEVRGASAADAADGNVRIIPGEGVAPFTYTWSTGDNSRTATQLIPGNYFVTVTDKLGCSSTLEVQVGVLSSIAEPAWLQAISLAPNPTTGLVSVNIPEMPVADIRVELLDMIGHVLQQKQLTQFQENNLEIDLGSYPNGVYFVRVIAERHLKTLKLIKQ